MLSKLMVGTKIYSKYIDNYIMGVREVIGLQGEKLPIAEFFLNSICENASMLMIAKRGSGKSYVCRAILRHFNKIPGGIIISPTERLQPFYSSFFPKAYIHFDYQSKIIQKLFARQKQMTKKRDTYAEKGLKVDPRCFILMDDCLGIKTQWLKDPLISELLFNGRHFGIMYILTLQYPLGIPPDLRSNFDYVFLLAEDYISNQKRLYDHYAGMFPKFDAFKETFNQLTANYGCMVIVNRGNRKEFLDKIFWYKAPKDFADPNFTMGCQQFRDFNKKNYNEAWEEKKNAFFDADDLFDKHRKAKNMIKVHRIGLDLDERGQKPKKSKYGYNSNMKSKY